MRYIIGVDGGGSQTCAVLVDDLGRVLGIGRSGSANHQTVGLSKALKSIRTAIRSALTQAKVKSDAVTYVQYCLAGADREKDFEILRIGLSSLPYRSWGVVSDAWEGLRAGTEDNVGVSVVCGTGTNAIGRDPLGNQVQVGGFGYPFGDAAGGSFLAVEAFRAAVRDWEGRGSPTDLTKRVPELLALPDMEAVFNHFLDTEAHIPLDLAVVVHEAATAGDVVSQQLLATMGRELGWAAIAVLDRLGHWEGLAEIPVILVGSVFQKGRSQFLLKAMAETVQSRFARARLKILDVAPVYGAVLLGWDHEMIAPAPQLKDELVQWEDWK